MSKVPSAALSVAARSASARSVRDVCVVRSMSPSKAAKLLKPPGTWGPFPGTAPGAMCGALRRILIEGPRPPSLEHARVTWAPGTGRPSGSSTRPRTWASAAAAPAESGRGFGPVPLVGGVAAVSVPPSEGEPGLRDDEKVLALEGAETVSRSGATACSVEDGAVPRPGVAESVTSFLGVASGSSVSRVATMPPTPAAQRMKATSARASFFEAAIPAAFAPRAMIRSIRGTGGTGTPGGAASAASIAPSATGMPFPERASRTFSRPSLMREEAVPVGQPRASPTSRCVRPCP